MKPSRRLKREDKYAACSQEEFHDKQQEGAGDNVKKHKINITYIVPEGTEGCGKLVVSI